MEPTNASNTNVQLSDDQLWGARPVLWGLRMLQGGAPSTLRGFSPNERREAADFLGVTFPAEQKTEEGAEDVSAILAERRKGLADLQDAQSLLFRNLHRLKQPLELDETRLNLIAFRAMLRLHPGFEALAGKYIGLCCDFVFHRKLAKLFGATDGEVKAALAPSDRLVASGLMAVVEGVLGPLESRIQLSQGLIGALMQEVASSDDLLARVLPAKREAHLTLQAYPHLSREINLLVDHLGAALTSHATGTNVLLCGTPGTGKTELAAALATALHSSLYALEPAPDDGESLTARERLRQLTQLQRLAGVADRVMVLIDEAEDMFPTVWSDSKKTPTKAAVNECLESNPTPTIWISNRTGHMDEAFLRRFDLIIRVPPLPSSAKRTLLKASLPPDSLEEQELQSYADRRELSPAMVTRMARVAAAGSHDRPGAVRDNLRVLSSHYLQTLGAAPIPAMASSAPLDHDPGLLNTDPPLDAILDVLGSSSAGARMLLHGAPGTGKTALAKVLAAQLDKPLLQHQASSLLAAYLGETEQNLRAMFDEAQRENGVLLLDEADGFLRCRDQARARWEITQTNELLTQMEAFEGVFVCTTNRLGDLDPAALRRFDLKVEFKPLRVEQRLHLFRQCCAALALDCPDDESPWMERAATLDGLTPGDAAAALRRMRLVAGPPTIRALHDALMDECRYKHPEHKPVGFLP